MRSFSGPAAVAARGRISGRPRTVVLVAACGELVGDKLARTPARIKPAPWAARIASGAYTGRAIAGAPGMLAAALAAGAGTFVTWGARKQLVEHTRLPDLIVAVCEDAAAYGLVALCTRSLTQRQTG
jgi:uncharacterized membrane protein